MEKSQTAELVIYAQSMQGREATELQVEAWHTLLGDLDFEVAIEQARAHFREASRELWPADVLRARVDSSDDWTFR